MGNLAGASGESYGSSHAAARCATTRPSLVVCSCALGACGVGSPAVRIADMATLSEREGMGSLVGLNDLDHSTALASSAVFPRLDSAPCAKPILATGYAAVTQQSHCKHTGRKI